MNNHQAWRLSDVGLEVFLRVTPNASADKIGAVEMFADGSARLSVRVRAIAEKGKANSAVIALLAKQFKLRKSDMEIIRGHQGRQKTLLVRDARFDRLIEVLKRL